MTEEEIRALLKDSFEIKGDIKVSPAGLVDVKGDCESITMFMTGKLPVQFGTVTGSFTVFAASLNNLDGCPRMVGGDFDCRYNELTDFTGAPSVVSGGFHAKSKDKLASLKGLPSKIATNNTKTAVSLSWHNDLGLMKLLTTDIGYKKASTPLELTGAPNDVTNIIDKYINLIIKGAGRNHAAISCSIELIRAGYKANAKL